ncbi:MAG: 2-oxoacid:acceptor oxidoreductase family protein [Burkholderiaceae bacterium]
MNTPGHTEIRVAGTGGQGLILAAKMLAGALAREGRALAQSQTYEPTSRGGYCNADLVVDDDAVDYPMATSLDVLVLLDRLAVEPSWDLLAPGALVIADTRLCPTVPERVPPGCRVVQAPLTRAAIDLGSERVANIVALGALSVLREVCDADTLEAAVRADTPAGFVELNLRALAEGRAIGKR